MVFAENEVHFLASKEQIQLLKEISAVNIVEEGIPTFKLHQRDEVNQNQIHKPYNLTYFLI